MTARLLRRLRGNVPEGGAVLILALLFVLIVGLVGGAIASLATTNLADTSVLGGDQNQSYAAESAVQVAIDKLRAPTVVSSTPGYDGNACPTTTVTIPAAGPGGVAQQISVACALGTSPLPYERTIVFAACVSASNCLTPGAYLPGPGSAAIIVATTVFDDLAPYCTDPTAAGCFVPGQSVAVTGWTVTKSGG